MLEKRLTKLERHVHQRLRAEHQRTLDALTNDELLDLWRSFTASGDGQENDSEEVTTTAQLAAIAAGRRLYAFEAVNGRKFVR